MLPNGGFPPIIRCEVETEKNKKELPEKGFFYSTKTNTINIRDILKKSNKKTVIDIRKEDEIETIDSL